MNEQIKCPHCGKSFPIDQAISHEFLEKEKQKLNEEARAWRENQIVKLKEKVKEEMDLQLKDKTNELTELKKQNQNLQEQLLELNKTLRQLRNDSEQRRIEYEKRLLQEEEKIRGEERKKVFDENRLRDLENEKKVSGLLRQIEELKQKATQGSQQLQGEVLELELESLLKKEFAFDEIKEVPKGIRGADILHVVKNNFGHVIGSIVWESKRTKSWSDGWITKLKEDKRAVGADLAVIVSQVLPDGVKNFGLQNDVWITNYESFIGVAIALRESLLKVASVKLSVVGKEDKKEILWNYLTGREFQQRMEAISDIYSQMQEELEIEKRWFTKKWAKQEKNIRQVIDSISGMDGDLKSITGKSLPDITSKKLSEKNP